MFEGWGFLIAEIWALIAIALLAGLIAGWMLFGRAKSAGRPTAEESTDALRAEIASLKVELAKRDAQYTPAVAPEGTPEPKTNLQKTSRPVALTEARASGADDLKQIKGIGPELEKLCNTLGFYHFDQIANWTKEEIAWVDENLEGFKGRVTRDKWVAQATELSSKS